MRACCDRNISGIINEAGIPGYNGVIVPDTGYQVEALSGGPFAYTTGTAQSTQRTSYSSSAPNSISFDMTKISEVYGRSNSVMPESINVPTLIYLGKHS